MLQLETTTASQGRTIKALQGGAAATMVAIKSTEHAVEEASHREVEQLQKRLEKRTGSMTKQMESLNKQIRTLELENSQQKAKLEAALSAER